MVALLIPTPSPKLHMYEVMFPLERFVKFTVSGAVPESGFAVNNARGAPGSGVAVLVGVLLAVLVTVVVLVTVTVGVLVVVPVTVPVMVVVLVAVVVLDVVMALLAVFGFVPAFVLVAMGAMVSACDTIVSV